MSYTDLSCIDVVGSIQATIKEQLSSPVDRENQHG